MHLYALIPIVAILVSAAFGAVSVVWHSGRRPTRLMCTIFACTGVWAFMDLMTFVARDAREAEFWVRWMFLPIFLLGPSVAALLSKMFEGVESRSNRLSKFGFALAVVCAAGLAMLPGSVTEILASDWGNWLPRYGFVACFAIPLATLVPVLAVYEARRVTESRPSDRVDASRLHALRSVLMVSIVATVSTEYVMPIFEIAAPRLGAIAIASASAVMWLRVRHVADDLTVTPDRLAQSMLDELHDGVALIQLDGTILAVSKRFVRMVGHEDVELIGESLEDLVETPLDEICAGLEDRHGVLRRGTAEALPVALSSSIARDRGGDAAGAVVIFRDLREIDSLRRRLLTSGRLAAIGELAAGIAHEVNNPVAFIRSDLHLLARRVEEIRSHSIGRPGNAGAAVLERISERVAKSLEGVERVAQVVGDVRGFAHVGGAGQGGSDPAVLVEGAMRLARLQRGADVEMRVVDRGTQEWIESGQELKQVLLALILLLVEGSEKGGCVEASVESDGERLQFTLSALGLAAESDAMQQRFAMLSVGDFGDSSSELSSTIAAELIRQLDASLAIDAAERGCLTVTLDMPIETGANP